MYFFILDSAALNPSAGAKGLVLFVLCQSLTDLKTFQIYIDSFGMRVEPKPQPRLACLFRLFFCVFRCSGSIGSRGFSKSLRPYKAG